MNQQIWSLVTYSHEMVFSVEKAPLDLCMTITGHGAVWHSCEHLGNIVALEVTIVHYWAWMFDSFSVSVPVPRIEISLLLVICRSWEMGDIIVSIWEPDYDGIWFFLSICSVAQAESNPINGVSGWPDPHPFTCVQIFQWKRTYSVWYDTMPIGSSFGCTGVNTKRAMQHRTQKNFIPSPVPIGLLQNFL